MLNRLLPLALLLLALPAAAGDLTLIYSGNLDGELEPCGCTLESDYGGLQRRATVVDGLRERGAQPVLISTGGLFSPELGADGIKNRYILSGLAQLDYDALGVQWPDLGEGAELLGGAGLPFAVGNWKDDRLPRGRQIERNGHHLYFTQWLDPRRSPYAAMPALSPITTDTAPLAQALKAADEAGALTLLGTTLSLEEARQTLPLEHVDILLLRSAYEQYAQPVEQDGLLVLQPGSRGQRLGRLELRLDDAGELTGWQHRVIELPDSIANAPRLDAWYAAYNEELRQDYLKQVKLRKAMKAGESPFVGADQCQSCHPAQYQRWQQSEHFKAFKDLEAVGKTYDSHCVGCHVVGFEKPGGYLDPQLSTQLTGVQCENCHGGGRAHLKSGGQVATLTRTQPKAEVCAQCHVKEHSPSFDVDRYWPKIAHPLKEAG